MSEECTSTKAEEVVLPKEYTRARTVSADCWVSSLTGCLDSKLLDSKTREQVFVCPEHVEVPGLGVKVPHILVRNIDTGETLDAGAMTLASVGDLQKAAMAVAAQEPSLPVRAPILVADVRMDSLSTDFVDVSTLQCSPDNKGCMFQAASNFNGVECISERSTPDKPGFASDYVYDRTQGPAASISAGPAALARIHAAFYDATLKPYKWGQTAEHQVEMLGDVAAHFTVKNGYVCNTTETLDPAASKEELQELEDKVKVLVHANVDAVYGRYGRTADRIDPPVNICQVFCAAMNLQQGASGRYNGTLRDADVKARLLLRAAYRGTYYAAEMYRCPKIYLTLIGGGVFGNSQREIEQAILDTHREFCSFNKFVREVHIIYFSHGNLDSTVERLRAMPFPWMVQTFQRGQLAARFGSAVDGPTKE